MFNITDKKFQKPLFGFDETDCKGPFTSLKSPVGHYMSTLRLSINSFFNYLDLKFSFGTKSIKTLR